MTFHIPQERLLAARHDGLTIMVIDRRDGEVPIYLPPNYVSGFLQAQGYIAGEPYSGQPYGSGYQPSDPLLRP